MTFDEARSVLGVAPGADARVVRDAFLRRVRANHPDVTAHPLGAGERTATIISAYRLLRDAPDEPTTAPAAPAATPTATPPPATPAPAARAPGNAATVEVITEEAIWVDAGVGAVGRALLMVADDLGEVSYVDRSGGLVQLTVRPPDGPTCWFTISAHGRPGGTVLVANLESIESQPTPPAGPLVVALAEAVADALGDREIFPDIT